MKYKILVVDDDEPILELLKFELSSQGYEVLTASNKEEFQTSALHDKPHLIILDILLGDDNGPLVYNELLNAGLDRHIPVIFLSALAGDVPPTPALPGRTYALHGKPFETHALLREIQCMVQ